MCDGYQHSSQKRTHVSAFFSLLSLSLSPYLNLYLVFILESVLDMNQTLGSNSSRLNVVQLDFKI